MFSKKPGNLNNMKKFVLLFRMNITDQQLQPSSEQMDQYMQQWTDWIHTIIEDGQLANGGNHFSVQGRVLKSGGEVLETPHISENISIAGYIIVLANNLDEATQIAMKCPILNGQQTSVEIRETAAPGTTNETSYL